MLTNEQLTHINKRLAQHECGQVSTRQYGALAAIDVFDLLAHIDALTTHSTTMQVALAQFSDKANWGIADYWNNDKGITLTVECWLSDPSPIELAERALVGDGEVSTNGG